MHLIGQIDHNHQLTFAYFTNPQYSITIEITLHYYHIIFSQSHTHTYILLNEQNNNLNIWQIIKFRTREQLQIDIYSAGEYISISRFMRIDSPSQIIKHKRSRRPKSYFQLVDKVGADGNYQMRIVVIFLLVWFLIGASFVNVKFLFQGSDFQCPQNGLLVHDCQQIVCQLPYQQRRHYLNKDKNQIKSMLTEISDYYCEDKPYITYSKLSFPLGVLVGLVGFGYFSDNFGRRRAVLGSMGFCCVGNIVLSASGNLIVASIGLLLSGMGLSSTLITTLFFFTQTLSPPRRQHSTLSLQLSFTLGTLLLTFFYYLIPQWRIISIIFMTVPSLISLFLIFLYIEQTPQFLLRKANDEGIKSLNRIGNLNYRIKEILEEEDILAVKESQVVLREFDEMTVSVSNIMRFGSLKFKLLDCCILAFATLFIYTASQSILTTLNLNIYSRHFIMQLSQLVILIPVYIYVQKLRRKLVGVVGFGMVLVLSAVMMFVTAYRRCDGEEQQCAGWVVEVIVVVGVRVGMGVNMCVLVVYMNELFPIRVSGLGVGTPMAFGQLAILIVQCTSDLLNPNLLFFIFCGLSFIAFYVSNFLTQTKGQPIKIDIEQVQILKKQQKSLLSGRNTFVRHSIIPSNFLLEHINQQQRSSLIL